MPQSSSSRENGDYIYSVTALNEYIKDLLDHDVGLMAVTVRGELSNYTAYSSGHHYFSLKDEKGILKCIMFKGNVNHLRFRPQDGMKVVAMGNVSVYPKDGIYQLRVTAMMPEGIGEIQAALERLKERLEAEGLFDEEHKKPCPAYPGKIALLTSAEGKAVWDMSVTLEARWPMSRVCVIPVRVQGDAAAESICQALDYVNTSRMADLIILGRGGGSKEDLGVFNAERVARAIYRSEIPVISSVGHTTNVTIADLVADVWANTPTDVARWAVPDQGEIRDRLAQISIRLQQRTGRELSLARERLKRFSGSRVLADPMNLVRDRRGLVDRQRERLAAALTGQLAGEKERFVAAAAKLDALSPLKVLGRGYAIPQKGERVLTSVEELKEEDRFTLRLRDGSVPCRVEKG